MSETAVRLRVDEFDRLMLQRGWKTIAQRCEALGVSPSQYSKVRGGQSRPGTDFIHKCMTILGVSYAVLFTDEQEEPQAVAS